MTMKSSLRSNWSRRLVLLIAGAMQPLAFAPFDLYPLAVLALLPLFAFWLDASPRRAGVDGLVYGLGMFGAGVSWVYVAIHTFGHSSIIVASALTFLFVLVLAIFPALSGYLARRTAERWQLSGSVQLLLWFPTVWTLLEWLRGWIFTGFPWLSLGYSQIDSPLRGFAPLLGVYGLTLLVTVTAGGILLLWRQRGRSLLIGVPVLITLWLGGLGLAQVSWTAPTGEPIRVTLIQGNVPQSTKWDPAAVNLRLERYRDLTQRYLDSSDLIVWPENAITVFYHRLADGYFRELNDELTQSHTDLILGVPLQDEDGERYYTTMMSLGSSHGFYRKRHLVPFGEYLPLERWLRGIIHFFNMPMSSFSPGSDEQPPLHAVGQPLATTVCYEDAFAAEMSDYLPKATLLVNGSNNAWYGDSLAPHQHLEISRMRALEFGRPMLRATTNGISAIIEPDGTLVTTSRQFKTDVIQATVQPMRGATPYIRVGNWAMLLLMLLASGAAYLFGRKRT